MRITLKNVKAFIQGYSRRALDNLDLLQPHKKEQAIWRSLVAKKCTDAGKCEACGCTTKNLELYLADKECEKDVPCYPEMMNKEEWDNYKKTNKLDEIEWRS